MKIEKFDHVHDVQEIYRKVLDCMSKPGTINNIESKLLKIDTYGDIPRESIGMAYLLLNTESSFYIEDPDMKRYLKLHTYANPSAYDKADYIFADSSKITEKQICKLVVEAKKGDLIDPHLGATLLINVEDIYTGTGYEIRGPGIKVSNTIKLGGLGEKFVEARDEANYEYPMGVDMIFVDKSGRVMALPRTIKVEVKS